MKITPENAPVGTRLLIKLAAGGVSEVAVAEWATSEKFVKFRNRFGGEEWIEGAEASDMAVEMLPAPPVPQDAPSRLSPLGEACAELDLAAEEIRHN